MQELDTNLIPQVVEMRGWETFVSNPPRYCRRVVEEFYASMTELPDDEESVGRLRGGVTWNKLFMTWNIEFANDLVIKPMEFWVAPDYRMKHTNLKLELGFWHIFISHSLPRSIGLQSISTQPPSFIASSMESLSTLGLWSRGRFLN
ncbi:hypothetical protein Q3G72_005359 [Acer saccharum]|nr:hypothetical protein Q3G72_005359 [Acer saccharum]